MSEGVPPLHPEFSSGLPVRAVEDAETSEAEGDEIGNNGCEGSTERAVRDCRFFFGVERDLRTTARRTVPKSIVARWKGPEEPIALFMSQRASRRRIIAAPEAAAIAAPEKPEASILSIIRKSFLGDSHHPRAQLDWV